MGKIRGFLDYERVVSKALPPLERIKNFHEFHVPLEREEQEIQGARCMDCGIPLGFVNEGGKRVLKEKAGSEKEIPAQLVLIAAGFLGTEQYVAKAFGAELDGRTNVVIDGFKTALSNVFAAGDTRRGQSLVVWAIREGRDAAREIDRFLMGYSNL